MTSFSLLDKENIQAFIPAFLRRPWLKNCISCSTTKINLHSNDHYSSKGTSFFLLQQVNEYTIFQVMSSTLFVELNLCMPELLRNHLLVPDACKELCCGQARWCSLTRSTTSACCSSLWYLQDSQKSLCCFAACWSWLGRSENLI